MFNGDNYHREKAGKCHLNTDQKGLMATPICQLYPSCSPTPPFTLHARLEDSRVDGTA